MAKASRLIDKKPFLFIHEQFLWCHPMYISPLFALVVVVVCYAILDDVISDHHFRTCHLLSTILNDIISGRHL